MRYIDFVDLNYKPRASDLICEFSLEREEKSPLSYRELAGGVAAESSVGTWTALTTEKPYVKKLAAKVFSINGNKVRIAYPIGLFEPTNIPNIMSSVAGNIFGLKDIKNLRFEDIYFPSQITRAFKGPQHGIEGIRKILKVHNRPLVGTIIKPKLGLVTKDHAQVAYNAWIGGCDIVKDDENLSSQSFNNFYSRVKETLRMRDKAEKLTGEKKIYMANVTAETKEMLKRMDYIKRCGGEYAMVDILTIGWSGLQTVREHNKKLKLVLHAHRAGHAAFTKGNNGISMKVIARLSRLIGMDQIHVGTAVGKMEENRDTVTENVKACTESFGGLKKTFPVCSGGLHPGHVPKLIEFFGKDIIIQMGGGIHGHPEGTVEGAKAARQAIDATMKGISLEKYAKSHSQLRLALEKWS